MTTRKPKVPADVAVLQSLVQEQAVTIATLTKERDTAKSEATRYEGYYQTGNKEKAASETVIEEVHALIDACPGAIARFTKVAPRNSWENEKDRENSVMVRLASFMGAKSNS